MRKLCETQTMNEQREIWFKRVRRVLLSQLLAYFVIGSERFLWKALGVPGEQRAMIEEDYKLLKEKDKNKAPTDHLSGVSKPGKVSATQSGQAIWNYGVETLDPVVSHTLVSEDNHYYLLCLLGKCDTFINGFDQTNASQANTPRNAIPITWQARRTPNYPSVTPSTG